MEALSTTSKQAEAKAEDESSLLYLYRHSKHNSTQFKRWTTFQCLIFCVIVVIITNLVSNMDRIVGSLKTDSSSSSTKLEHGSRCSVDYRNESIKLGPGDRRVGHGFASRSPATGIHGMAAASQPLVAQTAIHILKQGGNAVDAAIAANAMSGLAEPTHNGIGGDIMAMVYDPNTDKLYGYNGSGRSAMNFTFAEMLNISNKLTGTNYIPYRGPYGVTVPGTVQGWCDLHQQFGNLSWYQLFEPVIEKSRNGFAVTQIIADYFNVSYNSYSTESVYHEATSGGKYPHALDGWFATYANIKNKTPEFGDIFINKALGDTLEAIALGGCDAFYRGNLTLKMANYLNSVGSPLRFDDFANHYGSWTDPVNVTYRDNYLISELADNMQGIAALQMLNMMELYEFDGLNTADYIHLNVEIKKLVFADRAKYYADDSYKDVCIPIDGLISKEYALERNKLINREKAAMDVGAGDLECEPLPINQGYGDTIYLTTADANGMMVSLIQSNYGGFGSALTEKTLGFTFQNRGALFSLVNGSANQYDVGKRPFHTIIPAFMHIKNESDNGWIPYMSFGVMGGAVQPQGHVQIVSNMVDFGLNVQESGDVSRWTHEGSQQPTGQNMSSDGGVVLLESGICLDVANTLITEKGHKVRYSPNGGGYQAIVVDPIKGVYFGATELRKDGIAIGY